MSDRAASVQKAEETIAAGILLNLTYLVGLTPLI